MARIPNPYTCDVCRRPKEPTNHWWLIWRDAELNLAPLLICQWDEARAVYAGVFHLCGESCAQKMISKFLAPNVAGQKGDLVAEASR
jgi:hypothetical protein